MIYIVEKITACGRKAWADQTWKQGTHRETFVPRARRWWELGPGSAVKREVDGLGYIRRQSRQDSAEPTWDLGQGNQGCFLGSDQSIWVAEMCSLLS